MTQTTENRGWFICFAQETANRAGSAWAFGLAVAVIILWVVSGPIFKFSDTWQLVINTGTTIITFLMVFLIQNTQNRDSRIMQLKIDELLRSVSAANTAYIDMDSMSEDQLERLHKKFLKLAEEAREEHDEKEDEREEKEAKVKETYDDLNEKA